MHCKWTLCYFSMTAILANAAPESSSRSILGRDNNANTIQSDLIEINDAILKLTTSANTVDGTRKSTKMVIGSAKQLSSDIKSAKKTAKSIDSIELGQCYSLIDYLSNTIHPNEEKAIAALINKKQQFNQNKATGTVKQILTNIQGNFDDFMSVFCGVCSQTFCYTAKDTIHADWQKGLDAFTK